MEKNPIYCHSGVNHRKKNQTNFFPFFAIKLGHFEINAFFSSVENTQA
jgi:hypothetical protein